MQAVIYMKRGCSLLALLSSQTFSLILGSESLRVAGLVTYAFPIMETRRLIDHSIKYDEWRREFPELMYFVIHKAADLDDFFPHNHETYECIADLSDTPRYCAFVVFRNSRSHPQLEILGEEVYVLDEEENTFICLWPVYEGYPNIDKYFCFSLEHHRINMFHNYRNHDLPRLNVLTVSQTRGEEQQRVVNNVEVEIAPGRETGHLMNLGMDGSITFPRLLSPGGFRLLTILRWIKLNGDYPQFHPHLWPHLKLRNDVKLRFPSIKF